MFPWLASTECAYGALGIAAGFPHLLLAWPHMLTSPLSHRPVLSRNAFSLLKLPLTPFSALSPWCSRPQASRVQRQWLTENFRDPRMTFASLCLPRQSYQGWVRCCWLHPLCSFRGSFNGPCDSAPHPHPHPQLSLFLALLELS